MLLVGALALTACGADESKNAVEGSSAAANKSLNSSWQKDNFSKYYEQEISWRQCTEDDGLDEMLTGALDEAGVDTSKFQCGTVKAPIDWGSPDDGREINLAVVRIPATGKPEEAIPMFTNPGGPGVAGVGHAMLMASEPSFNAVREGHDLWGFDPRGVGKSSPVQCDSKSEIPVVQLAECAQTQPLAHFMGSSHVARDLELLRNLAGGKRLDYIGYSYGSMLGATYATLFPEQAGRMVFDSAEASQWASLANNYDQMVVAAKAIGRLADRCSTLLTGEGETVHCPFKSEQELLNFKKSLDEKPMKSSEGKEFNGSDLRTFMTSALYNTPEVQAESIDLLGQAKAGKQDAIDELVNQVVNNSAEISTEGQFTVCPSFPRTADIGALVSHIKEVGVPELLGGPGISDDLLSEFTDLDCNALPETGSDLNTFDASGVETPLMVIGITGDHATPYEHGKHLAQQLGKASFVTLEGDGHGASFSNRSKCIDELATAYLTKGEVPKDGTVCKSNAE